jgi:hypothetical protein
MQRIIQFCCSLQAKCPSALSSFNQIIASMEGKKIALFLDYDGTLSPIVNDPEKAFMSPEVKITYLINPCTTETLLQLCITCLII